MNSGGVAVGSAADVFQAYREPELTSLAPIAGISSYLPYGFVVRNPNHANDRVLPASPGVGVYDGLVTFAYRVPLQPTAADDGTTGARQLKCQTASVFERQGQRAWTGEHDSLSDSSDVDVTLNARGRLEVLFRRGLPVVRPQR